MGKKKPNAVNFCKDFPIRVPRCKFVESESTLIQFRKGIDSRRCITNLAPPRPRPYHRRTARTA